MTIKTHILKLFSILSVLALVFSNTQITHAAGLVVFNTNDSGAGSLRQAIADAASGDTITFAPALSGQIITLASQLNIDKNLTIDGSTLASRIKVSGNNSVRVFDIAKREITVTLNSLQIVNGFISSSEGGGLGNRGTLTIMNSVFSGNTAKHGGAIINGGTLSISDTAFTGNVAMGPSPDSVSLGGAIWSVGTLMIKNGTFTNNKTTSTGNGGAIFNNGPLRISNSTFSGNQAGNGGQGGALDNNSGGIADIENSIFTDNTAQYGGGISNYETLNITTSTFITNTSTGNGGGIWNQAFLNLSDSIFVNNTAGAVYMSGSGGGIDNGGTATITGSTFSKNTAEHGAAINNSSTLTVLNSTFSENIHTGILNSGTLDIKNTTISGGGAGVFPTTLGIYNEHGTLNLSNTILANSYSEDCFNQDGTGIIGGNVHNLIEANAAAPNNCGTPDLTGDPKLGALANNGGSTQTMSLLPGSPAIDAGDDASCPTTDQRGTPRPQGSHCDLGAYEVDNATMLITINSHPSNPTNSSSAAFTFSVTDNGGSGIASVECQLDGGGYSACTSPRNYNNLGVGSHTFQIKATDTLGYSRVAAFSWDIDTLAPDTTITAHPSDPDSDLTPSFSFSGNDVSGIASFMCKMDDGAFNPCTSPFTSTTLLSGLHTFSVYAIDNASNVDPSPASYSWTVVPAPVMVSSVLRAGGNPSSASSVAFTIKFSVEVTGVDGSDFQLTTNGVHGASIKSVSGSGDTYTVIVGTGLRNGSIRLDILSSANIVDGLGTGPTNLPYTGGESYSIVKTPKFLDVPFSHPYFDDIEILYANGLTGGCSTSPLKFCPDKGMNRAEAAVFMLRANFGSSYVPPVPTHIFKDNWSKGTWAEGWAEAMRNKGLSAGCSTNPLKYCPWDQIPREQAVIFALRMKYGTSYTPPPATGTLFADMTSKSYFATRWAEQAYKDGLIPNCGTTAGGKPNFCPKALVSRGLAAYMIVRAKNLTMP